MNNFFETDHRLVLTLVSIEHIKVIRDSFGIALLHFLIGPEKSRLFLNQSNSKFKPIATWSPAFSRASGCSVVLLGVITGFLFTLFCFDWLL